MEAKAVVALCRCGGSENKPFCDGSHKTNGYSGARQSEKPLDKKRAYEGKAITIFDNRAICCHAGHCVEDLPAVFRKEGKPWVDPDGAGETAVAALVARCPSGALSYESKKGGAETPASEPEIRVVPDGPYHVSGSVSLAGEQGLPAPDPKRFALCRCGASLNKPFCDGSHATAGFKD